jgi:hypothetical protein
MLSLNPSTIPDITEDAFFLLQVNDASGAVLSSPIFKLSCSSPCFSCHISTMLTAILISASRSCGTFSPAASAKSYIGYWTTRITIYLHLPPVFACGWIYYFLDYRMRATHDSSSSMAISSSSKKGGDAFQEIKRISKIHTCHPPKDRSWGWDICSHSLVHAHSNISSTTLCSFVAW